MVEAARSWGASLRRWGAPALLGVAGAVVALIALVAARDSRSAGSGTPGSSLATVHDGAKAAYLLLEKLGHRVERQAHPLRGYGRAQLAFLLAPQARLDGADAAALKKWIEGGGTLVYGVVAFNPEAPALAEALGLPALLILPRSEQIADLREEWAPARTLSVHATVAMKDAGATEDEDEDAVQALATVPARTPHADHAQPVALRISRGKGRIYVLDARVFSNAGLRQADNAVFLAALARHHAQGQPIAFDEFVHGFGEMGSLLQIARWPLRWGLAIGGLALVCFGLAAGRRLGRASPLPRPPRRASIEQIETLAGFFAHKKDRASALAALAARAGAPPPAVSPDDDAAFVAAALALQQKGPRWPQARPNKPPPQS
jgi:hypothetical protein